MEDTLKVGDIVEIEVYGEICCELCNDIIHNHIECPVCKKGYAETDQYGDLYDEKELTCECGTVYEIIDGYNWYGECKVKIKSLKT